MTKRCCEHCCSLQIILGLSPCTSVCTLLLYVQGHTRHHFSFDREPAVFDDVGGMALWKELNNQLKKGRLK
jgi:hypothetical protein